jgi:hypothetical protein
VRLSERAWSYFQVQDTSLELQGGFLPLFGIGSCSMSKAWVPMGRGASIEDKILYRRQQVATATCVTSVTCRCDCLCSHRPQKLRFEILRLSRPSSRGTSRGPFRTSSRTATVSPPATLSHKAWYSHLDLFVKIARALQLLVNSMPRSKKELLF